MCMLREGLVDACYEQLSVLERCLELAVQACESRAAERDALRVRLAEEIQLAADARSAGVVFESRAQVNQELCSCY